MPKFFLACASLMLAGTCLAPANVYAEPIAIAEVKRDTPVDFQKEIMPLLRRNCLACHNNTDAESDLVLETPASIIKGGALGPGVVPGKSGESLLLKIAAHQEEPVMPPEDNDVGAKPLTSEELGLLKLWIDQGATGDVASAGPLKWQPLPDGVNPVYAVAISPDGQYIAAGRANQIFVYHVPSRQEVGRLTDPAVLQTDLYSKPGVAHLDLVQSLRFSPDSQWLASGGYRTVKLWKRDQDVRKLAIRDLDARPTAVAISPDGRTVAVGQESGEILLFAGSLVSNLSGHKAEVSGMRFTADGARLVSGSVDQTLRVWSLAEEGQSGILATPAAVHDVAIVSDGKQLASAEADNVIRIWDIPEGDVKEAKPAKELKGHGGPVHSLASIGANGAQLLSGSQDATLRVWDVNGAKQVRSMNHGGPVEAVAVRPDGQRFASASSNKTSKLWDAANGKLVAELKGDFRSKLKVAEVERQLAVAKRRIENAKADLKTANDRKAAEEKNAKTAADAHKKAADELAKKEEEAKTALATKTEADKKLEAAKALAAKAEQQKKDAVALVAKAGEAIKSTEAEIEALKKQMDEAQKALVARQEDKKKAEEGVKKADEDIKNAATQVKSAEEEVKKATDPATKAVAARDAAKRTLESADRTLKRAEAAVKKVADTIPGLEGEVKGEEEVAKQTEAQVAEAKKAVTESEKPLYAVAFSRDGSMLATGGDDQVVRTWDATTGAAIDVLSGEGTRVNDLAFTPDGDLLSIGDAVLFWETTPEWKLVRVIGGVDSDELIDRVTALDFSPDASLLATGSGEPSRSGQLRIWQVADGKLVKEIEEAHSDSIFGLEFSPDGRQIASCGADRFAKVFDIESGTFVRAFEGHTHHVLGVTWRSDGRWLATSGADNVIKIWDVTTGDQRRTISGFSKEVTAIRFVSTGDQVVASSGDKTVQLKDANNGRNLRSFGGATDFLYSVSTSADGKVIAAGGEDSVVRVWQDDGKVMASFEPPQSE